MPIHYEIDDALKVIHERWVGDITIGMVRESFRQKLSDHRAMALRRTVADIVTPT